MRYFIENKLCSLAIVLSGFAYYFLAFETPRTDFTSTIGLFAILFGAFALVWGTNRCEGVGWLAWIGIGFRALVLFATPALSEDIYRYLWDGALTAHGISPFLYLPSEIVGQEGFSYLTPAHFEHLNSPDYFSVYPPFAQGIFAFCAWAGSTITHQILIFKSILLLAEIGTIYLIRSMVHHFQLGQRNVLIYALNPLVIMEVCGNGHLEGIMIFFFIWAVWLIIQEKWMKAVLPFAIAVSTKLIPLIALPFLFKKAGVIKTTLFSTLTLVGVGLTFLPFYSNELWLHMGESIDLYFHKFEFNASIFYVGRWIGEIFVGYDTIATLGTIMAFSAMMLISAVAMLHGNNKWISLPAGLLLGFMCYYLLGMIIHPWYLIPVIALSALCNHRFGLLWSFTVLLSYSAYLTDEYLEIPWLVFLEYALVLGWWFYEWKSQTSANLFKRKSKSLA